MRPIHNPPSIIIRGVLNVCDLSITGSQLINHPDYNQSDVEKVDYGEFK